MTFNNSREFCMYGKSKRNPFTSEKHPQTRRDVCKILIERFIEEKVYDLKITFIYSIFLSNIS